MKTKELTDEEFNKVLTDLSILNKGFEVDSETFTNAHIHFTNLIIEAIKRQYKK